MKLKFSYSQKKDRRAYSFLIPRHVPESWNDIEVPSYVEKLLGPLHKCTAHVLRSAGCADARGTKTDESSIQKAYLAAIARAKHFIFIENVRCTLCVAFEHSRLSAAIFYQQSRRPTCDKWDRLRALRAHKGCGAS